MSRLDTYGNSQQPIPARITLIRPDPLDHSSHQLFLDQVPIPREGWRYDAHDRTLSWQGAHGGGHLYIAHDGLTATGNIGPAHRPCAVTAGARAVFLCDVALNTGASYETSGGSVIGLLWDPSSAAWQNATWIQQRLQLTYTVTSQGPILPPLFTFDFQDDETQAIPWDPVPGNFFASLSLGQKNGLMVWQLSFKSQISPDPDQGLNPPTGPDTVYPYWLQAVEDAAAASINGAMQIDDVAPQGTLVGFQGTRVTSAVAGYYRLAPGRAPFAIFDGRLTIGGRAIPGARVRGDVLRWRELDAEHQQRTGLAEAGSLRFSRDGSVASSDGNPIKARRITTATALAVIAEHRDLYPELHRQTTALQTALDAPTLDMYGLLAMNPFAQNTNGAWGDMVQAAVTQDLSDIMNSFVPAAMWNLLFPSTTQPTLMGELATVANSAVPGVTDPKAWYQSLATAVMSQGLAGGSDDNCQNLNGPRAAAWLKTQVATSKVYYTHGQLLFQYEWQQRFSLTSAYLKDQINNASTYADRIADQVQLSVADITDNVIVDSASPPDLIATMIAQVKAVGQYAIDQNLYWAFAFFTYNTAPAILANIALQMAFNTGSSDGTTLSRLFQQNAAVLTAMDPSGYFAQQYTQTLNTFLATNIIPSMFGFLGDATSFDIIKEYLQQWVSQNLNNEDQQIAEAAAQINEILQDQEVDKILEDSIDALRSFAGAILDTMALPYVANSWLKWFSTNYPRFSAVGNVFGSLFIGGITGLAVFDLFMQFKSWDKLSAAQRTQLILNTTQLGLQIVAAVVKRGVRIYSIFNVSGMSAGQRAAAISRVVSTGEADAVELGLVKIGNTTARWLADTEGTIGKLAVMDQGVVTAVLVNDASVAAEEAGWAAKVFGKNLDEFIATRVGPVFILAGIGLSLYFIIEGESGVKLAADIINIVGGSLMLFAIVGGWAIEGGLIAAEGLMATIIAVAGPLAILAAIAGVALLIYEMFQKPPDPVAEFVDQYAKPAGFYVAAKDSSIDYATVYANPDQASLLMIGFSLSANGTSLSASNDGSIRLVPTPTALPDCVWQAQTDGLGMSQILTITQPDPAAPPVVMLLSLMSDDTVQFQPPVPVDGDVASVTTQTWLSTPQGNATLTSDSAYMVSLALQLQPVLPDQNGNYAPSQASGWLQASSTGVQYSTTTATTYTLKMSGMAPNYMRMSDVHFLLASTPSVQQSYGPAFGVYPSTPATFAITPSDLLPPFLTFTGSTGAIVPNGQTAAAASQQSFTITASNALGTPASADFQIVVATTPPPPPATTQLA